MSSVASIQPGLTEHSERFRCFGSDCGVWVASPAGCLDARLACGLSKLRLLDAHRRFSRFDRGSELTQLNEDPRELVPVSGLMASFVRAAIDAARMTDGIVDPTLLSEIEHAGYDHDLSTGAGLETILELAPARRPASPSPLRKWEQVRLISNPLAVQRPIGLRLDSGGIVKGLLADLISCSLGQSASYAIDCSGDLRIGGRASTPQAVNVQSPFHDGVIHRYELSDAGVATSGIGRRSWLGEDRTPMHHLLDPASGRAAFTGIVQVTALAPTAFEAEVRAKAALLSGVDRAAAWLVHGGTVVYEDGDFDVF